MFLRIRITYESISIRLVTSNDALQVQILEMDMGDSVNLIGEIDTGWSSSIVEKVHLIIYEEKISHLSFFFINLDE